MKNRTTTTYLMGEEGVTDSTGDRSRPLETWFEKEPNLKRVQNSAEHKKGSMGVGSTAKLSPALEQRQTAEQRRLTETCCATCSNVLTSTATVGSPLPAKKAGIPGRPLLPMLAMVTAFDMLLSDVPLIWTGIHVVELLPPVKLVDKGRKFG
jgi:hypothetical protein